MRRPRRNSDEDAVPASSGSAYNDHLAHLRAMDNMHLKSRKQIDRLSKLSTFAEQMRFHLDLMAKSLDGGNASQRNRALRMRKLINEYDEWCSSDLK